jgi:hypothetical protein
LSLTEEEAYPDWRIQPNAPILDSLLKMFIRLRRIRIDEGLDQLVFLQTQDKEGGIEDAPDLQKIAVDYVQMRAKLDQALQRNNLQGK